MSKYKVWEKTKTKEENSNPAGILYFNLIEPVIKAKNRNIKFRSSHLGTAEMNLTRNCEVAGLIPSLAHWVKDLVLL